MMNLLNHFNRKNKFLFINGLIGLILIIVASYIPENKQTFSPPELQKAAKIMEKSLDIISSYCRKNNININEIYDPFNTGLIGSEISEITTTTGHLEAKRTTINPNFAALIVNLLMEAGVNNGDTIAIGCSGSFPALLIASLSAAKAMNLNSRVILSIGSSSYGATNINFTLLDIYNLILDNNIVDSKPIAVSLGGENDIGKEFDEDIVKTIKSKIQSNGIPFIYEKNLQSNVLKREALYFTTKNIDIKAFINSGGGFANMGTSPLSLKLQPGLVKSVSFPEKNRRGVIFSMLDKEISVINLLFIKGIAQKYNLTWDPVSKPKSKDNYYNFTNLVSPAIPILSMLYLIYFCFILIRYNKLT